MFKQLHLVFASILLVFLSGINKSELFAAPRGFSLPPLPAVDVTEEADDEATDESTEMSQSSLDEEVVEDSTVGDAEEFDDDEEGDSELNEDSDAYDEEEDSLDDETVNKKDLKQKPEPVIIAPAQPAAKPVLPASNPIFTPTPKQQQTFFSKHKKWIIPTGAVVGVVSVCAIVYSIVKSAFAKKETPSQPPAAPQPDKNAEKKLEIFNLISSQSAGVLDRIGFNTQKFFGVHLNPYSFGSDQDVIDGIRQDQKKFFEKLTEYIFIIYSDSVGGFLRYTLGDDIYNLLSVATSSAALENNPLLNGLDRKYVNFLFSSKPLWDIKVTDFNKIWLLRFILLCILINPPRDIMFSRKGRGYDTWNESIISKEIKTFADDLKGFFKNGIMQFVGCRIDSNSTVKEEGLASKADSISDFVYSLNQLSAD